MADNNQSPHAQGAPLVRIEDMRVHFGPVKAVDGVSFTLEPGAYQVICNVYVKGKWDRVEHFHQECYDKAGAPFGEPPQD